MSSSTTPSSRLQKTKPYPVSYFTRAAGSARSSQSPCQWRQCSTPSHVKPDYPLSTLSRAKHRNKLQIHLTRNDSMKQSREPEEHRRNRRNTTTPDALSSLGRPRTCKASRSTPPHPRSISDVIFTILRPIYACVCLRQHYQRAETPCPCLLNHSDNLVLNFMAWAVWAVGALGDRSAER